MREKSSSKPPSEKRKASRIAKPINIVLRCPDKSGKSFIEKTQTVDISQTGAKAVTEHEVTRGARLQMAVPDRKKKSWATVARIGNKNGHLLEIGIALDDTADFWGVKIPEETAKRGTSKANGSAVPVGTNQALSLAQELLDSARQTSTAKEDDLSADREQARKAIEEYALDALRQLNEQATAIMQNLQEVVTQQAEEHLQRAIEAGVRQVESAAADATKKNQPIWEDRIQSLTDAAQKQLRAQLAEHEASLAASAAKARRELARKLANLSSAVAED